MFFIKCWKCFYGYLEFLNCPPSYIFNTWTQPFVLRHSNKCKLDITADLHWSTISKDIQKCPRVCACVQFSYAMLYRNVYFCNLFIRAWFTLCEMWRECLLPLLCSSYKNKSRNVFFSLRGKSVRNAEKKCHIFDVLSVLHLGLCTYMFWMRFVENFEIDHKHHCKQEKPKK